MARKIGVSTSEMLQLREQGLSNRDIANVLEISYPTVCRYIGEQGRHMESLAAFRPTPKAEELPKVEEARKPVDTLKIMREAVKSADGTFTAEIDYDCKMLMVDGAVIAFERIAEFATFVVGLANRVSNHK